MSVHTDPHPETAHRSPEACPRRGRPRGGTRLVGLVAHREITTQLRRPEFWVSLLVTAAVLAGSLGLQGLLSPDPSNHTVAVADGRSERGSAIERQPVPGGGAVTVVAEPGDAAAQDRVLAAAADAAVLADGSVVYVDEPPEPLREVLVSADAAVKSATALRDRGLDDQAIAEALSVPPPSLRSLDPEAVRDDQRVLIGVIVVFFVFFLMFSFGQTIAHGVLEEKSSRVVEVLLSKVRATQLLAGKVLGLGLVVVAQILFLVVGGFVVALAFDLVAAPSDALEVGLLVIAWFVPGYFLFGTLWAVAGALASRPEDVVNAAGPVSALMTLGLLGAAFPYLGAAPSLAVPLSMVPGFSWSMMPLRMAREAVPWWQVGIAIGLLALTITLLVRVAGRIYVGGLLSPGGLLKARTALRHAKESGLT